MRNYCVGGCAFVDAFLNFSLFCFHNIAGICTHFAASFADFILESSERENSDYY